MKPNRDLHKMTPQQLGELFPIIIEEPNERWGQLFADEKELILGQFQSLEIESIEHIGSTAISGIKAKPTIDILLEVSGNLENAKIIERIKSLGYQYIQQLDNPPPHMMFAKGYTSGGFVGQAYHIHVRYKGDWDEKCFRDFLNDNKQFAREYEELKLKLAIKFKNDREAYTKGKTSFVEKVNQLALKNAEKKKILKEQ
jgi:GrpB-like predicted nucleotidyltransferase (UPF0157 family)